MALPTIFTRAAFGVWEFPDLELTLLTPSIVQASTRLAGLVLCIVQASTKLAGLVLCISS